MLCVLSVISVFTCTCAVIYKLWYIVILWYSDCDVLWYHVVLPVRAIVWKNLILFQVARMIAYSETALWSIRKLQLPSLSIITRLNVIELGIKKQLINHPYHRSRAGHKLFHCIREVMNNHPLKIRKRGITLSNLREIKLEPKSKTAHSFINLSLLYSCQNQDN